MSKSCDIKIKSPKEITGKQELLMIPLTKFFCQKENITKLLDIVEGRSIISLRLIEWFVTNYCKKNIVMYNINKYKSKKKKKEEFNDFFSVFHEYKAQLKAYSKKHLDPFCRRVRIQFYYTKDNFIVTTVGQLNFFKWAIENHILDYIVEHICEIEDDMNSFYKANASKVNIDSQEEEDNKSELCKDVVKPKSNRGRPRKNTKTKNTSKKKSNKGTQRKKRRELSVSASKSIIKHHYPTVITFD